MGQPIAQQSDGLKNVDSGGRQLICRLATVISAYITVIPAQAGIPKGPTRNRHSRVSGNPDGNAQDQPVDGRVFRIPAYAGMTVIRPAMMVARRRQGRFYIQFKTALQPVPGKRAYS